jgi:nicotinic acid mononucleotide adenylyltransferase
MSENKGRVIVFTIGRMNPPTSGHLLLIRTMMMRALEFREPRINVILSHTTDTKKNPLECSKKREILLELIMNGLKPRLIDEISNTYDKNFIRDMEIRVLCTQDPEVQAQFGKFPMNSINALLSEYPHSSSLHLVIGEDRATDYEWIMNSLEKREEPVHGTIEAVLRPKGAMSATFIRSLVLEGDKDGFLQVMSDGGMDERIANQLYNELEQRLVSKPKTLKAGKGKSGKKRKYKRRTKRVKRM